MKAPYITVECAECGTHIMVPGHKAFAGVAREGGTVVYVTAVCPDCAHTNVERLSE